MPSATRQAPGGCMCGPNCLATLKAHECLTANGAAGIPVNYWTDSSKATLLDSGVTDANGRFTGDVGSPGTYWYEYQAVGRSGAKEGAFTVASCGGGDVGASILIPPATGYVCLSQGGACARHVPTTLHASLSQGTLASGVMVYSTTLNIWRVSTTWDYPGGGGCFASPGTPITIDLRNDVIPPLVRIDARGFISGIGNPCPTVPPSGGIVTFANSAPTVSCLPLLATLSFRVGNATNLVTLTITE